MFSTGSKLVVLFGVAILTVNAQDPSTPSSTDSSGRATPTASHCLTICLTQNISGSSCASVNNFQCLCTDAIFVANVTACVQGLCPEQIGSVPRLIQQECATASIQPIVSSSASATSDTDSSTRSASSPSGTSPTNSISRSIVPTDSNTAGTSSNSAGTSPTNSTSRSIIPTSSNTASNSSAVIADTSIPSGTSPTDSIISPSQPSTLTSVHHSTSKIAGAAVGGALFLVLVAVLILIRRRRSHKQDSLEARLGVSPFIEGRPFDRIPHSASSLGPESPVTDRATRKSQASKSDTNDSEGQESPVNMSVAFNRMRLGNLELQNRTKRHEGSRDEVYVDSGWRMPIVGARAQLGSSDIVAIPPPHYTET